MDLGNGGGGGASFSCRIEGRYPDPKIRRETTESRGTVSTGSSGLDVRA